MKRRAFLSKSSHFLFSLSTISLIASNCQKQKKPNIVLIMADDMGYSDLGCYGSEINTPNLNQLAENGIRLTHFYNTGRCCPSRASLLTGLYSHQAGIGDMTRDMGHPTYRGFLNDQCVTIPEVLKNAGYKSYISGKWHVGGDENHWPLRRGFDKFFGFPKGGGVYFYPLRPGRQTTYNDQPANVDENTFYSTDAINDYAVQFIKEHKSDNPFFLYIAHIAPHFPLQAHESDIKIYRGKYMEGFQVLRKRRFEKMKKIGILPEDAKLSDSDKEVMQWNDLSDKEKNEYDHRMAVYAAQIECMDRGLGNVFNALRNSGKMDNTLIIFISDNGNTKEDPFVRLNSNGKFGEPGCQHAVSRSWANVSNTPFRLYKHWVHEGGIASPCIMHYPAMIKESRIDDQVAHIIDLMPTCIDLSNAQYPDEYNGKKIKPLVGKSMVPIIEGKKRQPHNVLYWEHEGNKAIRKGKWKLVQSYLNDYWELYDIKSDRIEEHDLSHRYPDKVEELSELWNQWASENGIMPRAFLQQFWGK